MKKAIEPKPISKGATLGVVAPASAISKEHLEKSIRILQRRGFKVQLGEHIYKTHRTFSACDEYRLADLQWALDSPDIDAVICARGGYGCQRIIEGLNLKKFSKNPKWIVGFSDITALHTFVLQTTNICTVHGAMLSTFIDDDKESEDVAQLLSLLQGEEQSYKIAGHGLNKEGKFFGQLIGGNLALFTSMMATRYKPDLDAKILFLEDIGEDLYKLDRMMETLKLGDISKLGALVCGHFSDCEKGEPAFAEDAYEVIHEALKGYDFPVCYGFPSGHEHPNMAWIHGKEYKLTITKENVMMR
ncbi:MAG: LD-carboxypeptidase [Bacteroidales bacterium]